MNHPARPNPLPPSAAAPSLPREPSPSLLAHLQSAPVFQRLLAFVVRKNVPRRYAEDLVQQSLLEAWNARHTWGATTDDVDRLLSTIARRNVLDHQKSWFRSRVAPGDDAAKARKPRTDAERSYSGAADDASDGPGASRARPVEDDDPSPVQPSLTTPAAPHEARDRLEKVNAFVEATPRHRLAAGWLARNLAGESLAEIARADGATENAVTVAVSRLRSALRQAAKDGLILLMVTAFAGLLLTRMRHARPDGPSQGAPGPSLVAPDVPAPRAQARQLRERAAVECDAAQWPACARDLDAASGLDPEGDALPRTRALRARLLDATGLHGTPAPVHVPSAP